MLGHWAAAKGLTPRAMSPSRPCGESCVSMAPSERSRLFSAATNSAERCRTPPGSRVGRRGGRGGAVRVRAGLCGRLRLRAVWLRSSGQRRAAGPMGQRAATGGRGGSAPGAAHSCRRRRRRPSPAAGARRPRRLRPRGQPRARATLTAGKHCQPPSPRRRSLGWAQGHASAPQRYLVAAAQRRSATLPQRHSFAVLQRRTASGPQC